MTDIMSAHTVHSISGVPCTTLTCLSDEPRSNSGNALTGSSGMTNDLFAPPSHQLHSIAPATHTSSSAVHHVTSPVTTLVTAIPTHALDLHESTSPLRAPTAGEATHLASPSCAYLPTPFAHPPQDAARLPSMTAASALVDGGVPAVLPCSRALSSQATTGATPCDNPLRAFTTAPYSPAEAEFVSTVATLTCLPPGYRFSPKRHSTTSEVTSAEHRKSLSGVSMSTQRSSNHARPQHRVGQRFDSYDFAQDTASSSSPSPPLIHANTYLSAEAGATMTGPVAAPRRTMSERYGGDTTRTAAMMRRANSTLSSSFASTATRGSATTERGTAVAAHVSPHRLAMHGIAEVGRCYGNVSSSAAGCRVTANGTPYTHWSQLTHANPNFGGAGGAEAAARAQSLSPAVSLSHASVFSEVPREAVAAGLVGHSSVVLPDSRPGSATTAAATANASNTAVRLSGPCSLSPRDTAVSLALTGSGVANTATGLKRTASAASVTFTRNNVSVGAVSELPAQPVSVAPVTSQACCKEGSTSGDTPQATVSSPVPAMTVAGDEGHNGDAAADNPLLSLKNLQAHMQRCGTLPVQDSVERHTRTILSCLPAPLEARQDACQTTDVAAAVVAHGPGSPTTLSRPPASAAAHSLGKSFSSSSYHNMTGCPLRTCRFMSFDDVVDALEHTSEDELRAARARVRDSHRCACPDALLVPRQNTTLPSNPSLHSSNHSTGTATVTLVEPLQVDGAGDSAPRRATSFAVGTGDTLCVGASHRATLWVPQTSSLQRNHNNSGSYGASHRSPLTGSAVRHTVCLAAAVTELSLQRSRHCDTTAVTADEGRTMGGQAACPARGTPDATHAVQEEQGPPRPDNATIPVAQHACQPTPQPVTPTLPCGAVDETKVATRLHFSPSEALSQPPLPRDDSVGEATTMMLTVGWPGVTEGVDLLERKVRASHLFRIDAAQPARTPSPGALSANTSCEVATSQGVSSPTRRECHPPPHCWTGNDWSPCSDMTERGMASGSSMRGGLIASPQPVHDVTTARTPLLGGESGSLLLSSLTQPTTTQPLHTGAVMQSGSCRCAARPTRVRQAYTYIEVTSWRPLTQRTSATTENTAPQSTSTEATQDVVQESKCMRCVSLDDELYRISDLERWARHHKRCTVSYATPPTDTEILT